MPGIRGDQGEKMAVHIRLKRFIGVLACFVVLDGLASPPKLLALEDMSCQAWLATKGNGEERRVYTAWARGFLSGHNYANQRQQVTDVSNGTIEGYADRFCRENSKLNFGDALYRMSDDYSGRGAPISR